MSAWRIRSREIASIGSARIYPRRPSWPLEGLGMERLSPNRLALLLVLGAVVTSGCISPRVELDLEPTDPAQDHRKIATCYSSEAGTLQQMSKAMVDRIAVYERLFGPNSDWVAGTRLLAQSYEEAAKDYERKASEHLELANDGRPSPLARPELR